MKANIAIGENKENINEKKLKEAVQMSKINEFLPELVNGLNTKIGEQGSKIFNGQKQRIALARAFYHSIRIFCYGCIHIGHKSRK